MLTLLERLIEEKGLRKSFVAERCGMSPSAMSRILSRERPVTKHEASDMALAIGVPEWVFYDGEALLENPDLVAVASAEEATA